MDIELQKVHKKLEEIQSWVLRMDLGTTLNLGEVRKGLFAWVDRLEEKLWGARA